MRTMRFDEAVEDALALAMERDDGSSSWRDVR
jgi:hypothetical protein